MTGLEPPALGAAVVRAAAKATDTDPDVKPDLIKVAVNHPAFDAAAASLAKRTAVKERIRLQVWRPFGWLFGVNKRYFDDEFPEDMANAMSNVPEGDFVSPPPSVAGPAVQGLLFVLDEPALKRMYIQLLASASDRRSQEDAHPAYAEIIRQLSSEEAEILQKALFHSSVPIVNIVVRSLDLDGSVQRSFVPKVHHLLDWRDDSNKEPALHPRAPLYVENWIRLGLVNVSYTNSFSDPTAYDWAEIRPEVAALRLEFDSDERKRVHIERGILSITDFGRKFGVAAVPTNVVDADSPPPA